MKYRYVGKSGLRVSLSGLGCNNFGWRIDFEGSRGVVHAALDAGITFFDTADIYGHRGGSEECLGKILGPRRKDIVLATKFGMAMADDGSKQGGSRGYIMKAVHDSLRRLQTDYIDLYQMHELDPVTPIDETLRALDDLVRSGKVRYVGCSNFPAWRMAAAQIRSAQLGTERFISFQDELSLVVRHNEKDVMPCGEHYGMGMLPFFPLASGLLTGKYKKGAMPAGGRITEIDRHTRRYATDHNFRIVEELEAFARKSGHSLIELAFSWLASKQVIASVIAGATKPEQVAQNVQALSWSLSAGELAEIDRITLPAAA
jgi:aryl-alcohol dehydrogenase-like predicted oxidoreductase